MDQKERLNRTLYKEYAQGVYDGGLSAFESLVTTIDATDFSTLSGSMVAEVIKYAAQVNIDQIESEGPIPWEERYHAG